MNRHLKILLVTALLAFAATPALALGKSEGSHGKPEGTPNKGKAYGRYCKEQSHKHVKGEKGTPFSQCVKAMAQAAKHEHMAPGRACREMSHKHVKGEQGTPFSQCVKGVAQLREDEEQQEEEATKEGEA
jgi:hypothetical protein